MTNTHSNWPSNWLTVAQCLCWTCFLSESDKIKPMNERESQHVRWLVWFLTERPSICLVFADRILMWARMIFKNLYKQKQNAFRNINSKNKGPAGHLKHTCRKTSISFSAMGSKTKWTTVTLISVLQKGSTNCYHIQFWQTIANAFVL